MSYQTLLKYGLQWFVAISLWAVTIASSAAEQGPGVKGSQADTPAATRSAVIYKPPLLDAPRTRVDGGAGDTGSEAASLQVLAPDHAGLTTQVQPTLYWYARTPVAVRFEFVRIDEAGVVPLLEVKAGSDKVAGIQQLNLGDHNISLQPELAYQWSVAPVMDEDSRSTAVIERMKPGEGLTSRIEKSRGMDLVGVYAIEGIWYDALETISSMIDKSPEDQGLVAIRASLLDQVGLQSVTGN